MGTIWEQPSPSDLEQFLADVSELGPYDAARKQGRTCSVFRAAAKRNAAFAEAYAEAKLDRQERLKGFVGERLVTNVERAMQAVPVYDKDGEPTGEWTWNGSVANKSLELIGKTVGMFGERLEVTGADGGPVEVRSDISASLDRLNEILAAATVRASADGGAAGVPGLAERGGAGRARLAVARVAGTSEPA